MKGGDDPSLALLVRHSPNPYAGQPAPQEHQRLWPWRCFAPGSEARFEVENLGF